MAKDRGSICVGIRTLDPNADSRTVRDVRSLGFPDCKIIFETEKGPMGRVTNLLLDKMKKVSADYYLIVDDDISFSKETFDATAKRLEDCNATSVLPIPDDDKLEKYYKEMYSRYAKRDIEPFTFSFALIDRKTIETVRVNSNLISREEHDFYEEMTKHNLVYKAVHGNFVVHLDKNADIDARHNCWYAAGMSSQDSNYKNTALLDLILSPLEGFFYWVLIGDIFGLKHTINLRYNAYKGASGGYHGRS